MRIFKTKWFDSFTHKSDIHDCMLIEAVERAENGLVDADLGNGVLNSRLRGLVRESRKGIVPSFCYVREIGHSLVYGFSKKDRDSLRQDEEEDFREMAGYFFLSRKPNCLNIWLKVILWR